MVWFRREFWTLTGFSVSAPFPQPLPSGIEKEEQCPMPEAWDVDQGLIAQLKEQYRKERKGKKGVKSKSVRPPLLSFSPLLSIFFFFLAIRASLFLSLGLRSTISCKNYI